MPGRHIAHYICWCDSSIQSFLITNPMKDKLWIRLAESIHVRGFFLPFDWSMMGFVVTGAEGFQRCPSSVTFISCRFYLRHQLETSRQWSVNQSALFLMSSMNRWSQAAVCKTTNECFHSLPPPPVPGIQTVQSSFDIIWHWNRQSSLSQLSQIHLTSIVECFCYIMSKYWTVLSYVLFPFET